MYVCCIKSFGCVTEFPFHTLIFLDVIAMHHGQFNAFSMERSFAPAVPTFFRLYKIQLDKGFKEKI